MVRVGLLIKRFRVQVSGRQELYSALYTLNTKTEVPLSKSPNPQLLPGLRRINGCPLLRVCVFTVCVVTAVCVHFGWVNAEHKFWVWVTILGRMSRHFHIEYKCVYMGIIHPHIVSCHIRHCLGHFIYGYHKHLFSMTASHLLCVFPSVPWLRILFWARWPAMRPLLLCRLCRPGAPYGSDAAKRARHLYLQLTLPAPPKPGPL